MKKKGWKFMERVRNYAQLHLNIMLFSFTGVFSKLAAVYYNRGGLSEPLVYLFAGLMLLNCAVYAVAWQRVIRKFSLSAAYSNKNVYLIWSQLWAFFIFRENITVKNMIGMLVILVGVWMVQKYE